MNLQKSVAIPISAPIRGRIRIPGSKSLTNRTILIASLAKGQSNLKGVLHSDDTRYMLQVCQKLGITCREEHDGLYIQGCEGKLKACDSELYVGNAGTAARFLTAMLPLGIGEYILTGNERMQQRPIRDLIDSLRTLGVNVTDINGTGCPPVRVHAGGLPGGMISIPGDKSSQYISALMMSAPYARTDTTIHISGELVSRSYAEMTRSVMNQFQADCQWQDDQTIRISAQKHYQGREFEIEGDASSASYFFGMAAVTGGEIKVAGLTPDSNQGDLGLLTILEQMGCHVGWQGDEVTVKGNQLQAIDVDMNTMSDVAPTLAVIGLFAEGTTLIRRVGNMRIKECDRISAIVTELRKLGAAVEEWDDGLSVQGNQTLIGAELDTYDDHRMAMSLSLAGLKIPGVVIRNPECVSKTFPRFYDMFLLLIQG